MEERPFTDKNQQPTNEKLKEILLNVFDYYKDIKTFTNSFHQEWNYSKSSGWMEKISSITKALFYIIPLRNALKISMTIRDKERNKFLEDQELANYKNDLEKSKKFTEGYQMVFQIENDKDYEKFHKFMVELVNVRK